MNPFLKLRILEKFGTQANFAQDLKVDESLVSRIIRGRRVLPQKDQIEWARRLTCGIEEIFPVFKESNSISPKPNQEEAANEVDSDPFSG